MCQEFRFQIIFIVLFFDGYNVRKTPYTNTKYQVSILEIRRTTNRLTEISCFHLQNQILMIFYKNKSCDVLKGT